MLKKQLIKKNRLMSMPLMAGALALLLSGCTSNHAAAPVKDDVNQSQKITSVLAASPAQKIMMADLKKQGVNVFQIGGTIIISIPSDKVFHPDSANLNPGYVDTLDKISAYMSSYDKKDVKVQAYTDNFETAKKSKALSTKQAQVIINYIWSRGTDSRLMYAIGKGNLSPIADNHTIFGMEQNRRVVISFKFYPKVNEWN